MAVPDPFTAVLLGTAVGDALGLPAEGMSPQAIAKRWGGEWRMRLVFGRGMLSDDTEHTTMVALALLTAKNDVTAFQRELARRLRWWFAALPAATGLATARSIIKLWLGVSPAKSGVWSAGNGPAMRSAIIGAFYAHDAPLREAFVKASTLITHTDPRAEVASQAVAAAAAAAVREGASLNVPGLMTQLRDLSSDKEWSHLMEFLGDSLESGFTVQKYAQAMGFGRGVTGYAYQTVPVALYAWLRYPGDFRRPVIAALDCGGDTDTVGAITGALAALTCGPEGIPPEWVNAIADWPLKVSILREVGSQLQSVQKGGTPPDLLWSPGPGMILRNLGFLGVVLVHGIGRWLPFPRRRKIEDIPARL